jgi:peptidoglycan-associated lipoprotein
MHMQMSRLIAVSGLLLLLVGSGACAKRQPPATPQPPPEVAAAPAETTTPKAPPPPPPVRTERVEDAQPVSPAVPDDSIGSRSIDDLNRDSPLKPAFFPLDSSDLDDTGRAVVAANADVMKKYRSWVVTIEGHADERGTAEYNLALGERRALAVKTYLMSLGIAPDRLRTVSYGKEFPFDPGHDEAAWSKNRRAHFVITAK